MVQPPSLLERLIQDYRFDMDLMRKKQVTLMLLRFCIAGILIVNIITARARPDLISPIEFGGYFIGCVSIWILVPYLSRRFEVSSLLMSDANWHELLNEESLDAKARAALSGHRMSGELRSWRDVGGWLDSRRAISSEKLSSAPAMETK